MGEITITIVVSEVQLYSLMCFTGKVIAENILL